MLKPRKRPNTPFYIARGTINGKRIERSTGASTEAAAWVRCAEIEAEERAGEIGDLGITLIQAAAIFIEDRPEPFYLGKILAEIGDLPVAEINNGIMRRTARQLFPGKAKSTIARHLYAPVRAIINHAADEDICEPKRFKVPTGGKKRTIFQMPDQAEAIIDQAAHCQTPCMKALLTFFYGQGSRVNETLQLRAEDVSLANRIAVVRDTKNDHERALHLVPRVVAALSTLPTINGHGLVFTKRGGDPFRRTDKNGGGQIKRAYDGCVERAGLNDRGFTPHTMRHSFATWFYGQTQDVVRLKSQGWRSEEWQRYVHLATPELGQMAFDHGWDFRASPISFGAGNFEDIENKGALG
ncbi:MAG: tyrosine-type recombinase/integrase [Pseudomonadota bacterium]